jgi:tetratricopeptide (TPR) repeat protein
VRRLYILFILLISSSTLAVEFKDIKPFEDKILELSKPLMTKKPLKAYELRLLMAREYYSYGFKEKALEHYEEALKIPVKVDRSEALINSILLSLSNKKAALEKINRLKRSSEGKNPELQEWIRTVESYAQGSTALPKAMTSPFYVWARDSKIEELIKEGKIQEAFQIIGPVKEDFNINSKVRYDLLASAVAQKISPNLWCEKTLAKYPNSLTWTMRICRYLKDKRGEKKSNESIESIKAQIEEESPERLSWVKLLEGL